MFPLGTVLFPGAPLPLRVFEPRYRALARRFGAPGGEFGVVLIERGHEVGGGDRRFPTGTVARVVESAELDEGGWVLLCAGVRRIRVRSWLADDPYPRAVVDDLEDRPLPPAGRPALARAEGAVGRALALAAEVAAVPVPPAFERGPCDTAAAWRLAELAPLGPVDRQRLLESDDPERRLELLADLADEASEVLAFRLSGA